MSTPAGPRERPGLETVTNRALVLYALVRRAYIEHVMNASAGDQRRFAQGEAARFEQDRWLAANDLTGHLTDVEVRLFGAESGTWPAQAVHDALWRKESLGVLLWALQHLDVIPPYGSEFDQPDLDHAVTRSGSIEQFRALGKLRREPELEIAWREADTWFAATEGDEGGADAPSAAGEDAALASAAAERLRALAWLLDAAAEPA